MLATAISRGKLNLLFLAFFLIVQFLDGLMQATLSTKCAKSFEVGRDTVDPFANSKKLRIDLLFRAQLLQSEHTLLLLIRERCMDRRRSE